jgi:DNA-binding CsgD family transcriptional regulator
VSLTLSSGDVTQLEAGIATAIAPLVHDRISEWRGSVRRALEPMLGAHKSIFVLSADHEPPFYFEPDILPAMAAYQAHFHALDPGFPRQARAFARPVWHWWMPTEALRARYRLRPREVQVARLLARGWSNSRIADELAISLPTTRRHVEHVLLKLDTRSRAAVATKLLEPTGGHYRGR